MEEETLLLTQRDRDRLKVLHEVRKGHITQRQAGWAAQASGSLVRELVERIGGKDKAVIHGLRGAASNRKIAGKIDKRAMEIVRREYADFGPTLASEYLERDHQITASKETVRQRMLRAGIWKRRKQRIEEVHMWRARRSYFGELVQWDTSDHDWLEGRGARIYLIGMRRAGAGAICAGGFDGGEHASGVGVAGEVWPIRGWLYGSSRIIPNEQAESAR